MFFHYIHLILFHFTSWHLQMFYHDNRNTIHHIHRHAFGIFFSFFFLSFFSVFHSFGSAGTNYFVSYDSKKKFKYWTTDSYHMCVLLHIMTDPICVQCTTSLQVYTVKEQQKQYASHIAYSYTETARSNTRITISYRSLKYTVRICFHIRQA